jgi:hypothetical protein
MITEKIQVKLYIVLINILNKINYALKKEAALE